MSKEGVEAFVHAFSMPGGFPSHVNAEVDRVSMIVVKL